MRRCGDPATGRGRIEFETQMFSVITQARIPLRFLKLGASGAEPWLCASSSSRSVGRSPGSAGEAARVRQIRECASPRSQILVQAGSSRGLAFDFDRLRSGPFEGPATVIPPALPEDTYLRSKPLNELYKKGCQEKKFCLDRRPRRFLSRHPAHSL